MSQCDKKFKLRKQIKCHSMDIRAIAPFNGGFVTGSRDREAKAFLPTKTTSAYNEFAVFKGAQHFIASIAVVTAGGDTLIYVGSNDYNIYCFKEDQPSPHKTLEGHLGTVCALSSSPDGLLISGSWDLTARIWSPEPLVLPGHEGAVWAVGFIAGMAITGCADKKLRLFNEKAEVKKTFEGHTDCVRGLVVLTGERFASCSNDATVKVWSISGECLQTLHGHDNYIYSIANLSPDGPHDEFVTCSEDRTVRYWLNGNALQTIRLPASTLWDVAALDAHNFAVAASNGTVYVFTSDETRVAPAEDIAALEEEVSKSQIPLSDLGDIKVDQLPGSEVLLAPGTKDGQTKLVRDGATITVYQWAALKQEWAKVGDVVGAANQSKDPSQKTSYEGKDYDYVFSVDIKDGEPPLKLPYNVGENPYDVAQTFIHKHDLSQAFLDEIAAFITKNSAAVTLSSTNGTAGNTDPFTGGGSYHSGTGGMPTATDLRANADPFTGSGSYHTGGAPPPAQQTPTGYFPHKEFIAIDTANVEGIAKKIKEFAPLVPPDLSLNNDDIKSLLQLTDPQQPVEARQIGLLRLMVQWPKNYMFPVLDLLRLCMLLPKINSELCSAKDSARLIDNILVCVADQNSQPNQMCALRTLANMFVHPVGEGLVGAHIANVLKVIDKCARNPNKNIQIALATVYLNYSILTSRDSSTKGSPTKMETLIGVTSYLGHGHVDPEAVFRLLVALGNLITDDPELRTMSRCDEVLTVVKQLEASQADKVRGCAMQLRALLA